MDKVKADKFFIDIADLKLPGHIYCPSTNNTFKIEKSAFKDALCINDDPKFDFLTGSKVFIAGGSILSWVMGTEYDDIDFFFLNTDAGEAFYNLLSSFSEFNRDDVRQSSYALTVMTNGHKVQLVGVYAEGSDYDENDESKFSGVPYGEQEEIVSNFDISACQILVDSDYVWFTSNFAYTFVTGYMKLSSRHYDRYHTYQRIEKYARRGFKLDRDGFNFIFGGN